MNKTKIDWCDSTWNPVTGCQHNCEYCYARTIANRFEPFDFPDWSNYHIETELHWIDNKVSTECRDGKLRTCAYPYGFEPTFHRYRLNEYFNKKGRNIFVCSMADLFGDWVPESWIEEVLDACDRAPQHNYLFLTKNAERYVEYGVPMSENMWYGATITRESEMHLFNSLPAFCNIFVSIEPILEDLQASKNNLLFRQVHWVIVGTETGRRRDKVIPKREWIEGIINECRKNGTPVFMKSSLAEIWGEPLIQEFPEQLKK